MHEQIDTHDWTLLLTKCMGGFEYMWTNILANAGVDGNTRLDKYVWDQKPVQNTLNTEERKR